MPLPVIVDVSPEGRGSLKAILEESFEGWYLSHSLSTLREIEVVKSANVEGEPAGLAMLKMLTKSDGYVYYIAVARKHRRIGIGGRLLDESLSHLASRGAREVYASIEEHNIGSQSLFESRGFAHVTFSEMSSKYGVDGALNMYPKMLVVPGEFLLGRPLS